MLYLWPQAGRLTLHADFGVMTRASDGRVAHGVREGRWFAVDNEAFTRGVDETRFLNFLEQFAPYVAQCLFVVVPDVVADSAATLALFEYWQPRLKALEFPVAFVLQDGQEELEWPMVQDFTDWLGEQDALDIEDDAAYWQAHHAWEQECIAFDALFVGGTTEYKLSPTAAAIIQWAKGLGLWVHVGRVNSLTRFKRFQLLGADSCDGTSACYAPDQAAKLLTRAVQQRELFQL